MTDEERERIRAGLALAAERWGPAEKSNTWRRDAAALLAEGDGLRAEVERLREEAKCDTCPAREGYPCPMPTYEQQRARAEQAEADYARGAATMRTRIIVEHGKLDVRIVLDVEKRVETWEGADAVTAPDMHAMMVRAFSLVPETAEEERPRSRAADAVAHVEAVHRRLHVPETAEEQEP